MNNDEKVLKEIIKDIIKSVGNSDLYEKPILIDLDKLEIKTISKDEGSDILNKYQVANKNEDEIDILKEFYKNVHSEEDTCEEKVKQEDINPFEINMEIEDDTDVLIYLPYEDKDDLFSKISDLADIFDESITNNIYVDKDEKLIKVEIYKLISQNEIFDLLSIFGENVRLSTAGDCLWIIVDDCI